MYPQSIRRLAVFKVFMQGKSLAQASAECETFNSARPCLWTVQGWVKKYLVYDSLELKLRHSKFGKRWSANKLSTLLTKIDDAGETISHEMVSHDMVCETTTLVVVMGWFVIQIAVRGQTCQILKKLNVTRKKVVFLHVRQDPTLVYTFKNRMLETNYKVDQMVVNDENYVNKQTLNFCY